MSENGARSSKVVCRMDIRYKNRTGRRSTRTVVEEQNLETRGVTIRSRRFHSDNKLEMTVREWWRMEHPIFYHDFFHQLVPGRVKCRMCSEVMFQNKWDFSGTNEMH